jgi:hypothetical protein
VELACDQLLKRTLPQSHLVQFYGPDDQLLTKNAGRFLAEGLKSGGVLVIGSAERNRALAKEINRLGGSCWQAEQAGRLRFLDAEETLRQFMIDGQPYWGRFERTIGSVINKIRESVGHGGLRAYGEMVGLLWSSRQFSAAVRLEQFWNKLLSRSSASLFCGYPIDIFASGFEANAVDALLCAHTHMLPSESKQDLENSIHFAMHAVLGAEAGDFEASMEATHTPGWAAMPKVEAKALWIRNHLPRKADEILARARQFLSIVSTDAAA